MSDGNGALPDDEAVPESWNWTTIEDIARVGTGTTPRRGTADFWDDGSIPWVASAAVNQLTVTEGSEYVTQAALEKTSLKLYPKHTLIVALYGEGKTRGKVSELMIDATINQALAAIQMDETASDCRDFLKWFLHSNYQAMRRRAAGGMQPNLNLGVVKSIRVPVAPLGEQRRIVSKIESLQERSSRARRALSEVGPLLEQFRQSVLRAAFSGRLTADWRAAHRDVEPATELLSRIRTERRHRWEQSELAKYEAKGKTPPQNWQDKYKEPQPVDDFESLKMPDGWVCIPLGHALDVVTGKTPSTKDKSFYGGNIPFVKPPDLDGQHPLLTTEASVTVSGATQAPTLPAGSVLVSCIGNLGKVALLGREAICNQQINAILPAACVDPEFLYYWVMTIRDWMDDNSSATTVTILNKGRFEGAPLLLPPLAEQCEISRLLRAHFESIAVGEDEVAESETALTQLDQSILAKAFRGELVPQDPRDEPASELLARIRTTREAAEPAKRKRTRNRSTPATK